MRPSNAFNRFNLVFIAICFHVTFTAAASIATFYDVTTTFDYVSAGSLRDANIHTLDGVHIRGCHSSQELALRVVRNHARVTLAHKPRFDGWVQFVISNNFDQFAMFGLYSNDRWYFLELKNNRFFIRENDPPGGPLVDLDDPRLFQHYRQTHSRKPVLLHHTSQVYLAQDSRGRIDTTKNEERAINVCVMWNRAMVLQYQCTVVFICF